MAQIESLLEQIQDPRDLEGYSYAQLDRLAAELRSRIVSTVSRNGGHLSSNLGVVELTIALHRVFRSPYDRIVWDVGHQCYAHKLLTGRAGLFDGLRRYGGIAGFPRVQESPHDGFNTGHASTSISAALGLLAGERLAGRDGRTIAVIGDGALSGGEAYEGLSHAGHLGLPLIVILNDNKMSIGPNVGGLSKYLSRLSMKPPYRRLRPFLERAMKKIPLVGNRLFGLWEKLKRALKAFAFTDNFFVDLGFAYVGPIDGHSIKDLEEVLSDVKNQDRPVVVHVITQKGKGYQYSEADPGAFHGVSSFSVDDGLLERRSGASFTGAFSRTLVQIAGEDPRVAAVTAAMEQGTGLGPFREKFPERFFDVGIAEAHLLTFAAGLAASGMRPVAAVYSTFLQRGVDQVIHDIALQNLPVVLAVDRAGFVGDDGETHQGLFDIALLRSVPNMKILAPAGAEELALMLRWALEAGGPAAIRYPKANCPPLSLTEPLAEGIVPGRGVFVRETGAPVLIAFSGGLLAEALDAAKILEGQGVPCDLYNLRFLKPLDEAYFLEIVSRYSLVLTAEEGALRGGFGEYAAALVPAAGLAARLVPLGAPDAFAGLGTREELLKQHRLDGPGLAGAALAGLSANS